MTLDYQLLLSLAVIHTLALASPGPDFALVVKLASQERRQTALACALGLAVAITMHTILSLTGVSLIIKSSSSLYTAVQLMGASYLAWMGYGAIRGGIAQWRQQQAVESSESASQELSRLQRLSGLQGFIQGMSTNLLNPKALVFFITLFSSLITPQVSIATKIAITALLFSLSLVWFSLIALVLSKPSVQQKLQRAAPAVNLLTGALFISVTLVIISRLF